MPETTMPLRIVIADDHALVRGGLGILIRTLHPGTQIIECNDYAKVLKALDDEESIDLLLIDLMMPGMETSDSIQHICGRWPDVPVVVVSVREDMQIIRQALREGAAGYIPKTSTPDVTLNAIRLVLSGGIYIPPDALELRGAVQDPDLPPVRAPKTPMEVKPPGDFPLTNRQADVLSRIADGKSNKEVGEELGLTAGTIKMHLSRIYKVLKAKSRTDAVAKYAKLRNGG